MRENYKYYHNYMAIFKKRYKDNFIKAKKKQSLSFIQTYIYII